MFPTTSPLASATKLPTDAIEQLRHLLRERQQPAKINTSPWLTAASVQHKQQQQPALTPTSALLALLDETLAALATDQPHLADLLHGRFWEGLTVDEMVAQQRPEPQSIRRFHQQQDQALHAFVQLLAQTEARHQQSVAAQSMQQHLPIPTYAQLFGIETRAAQLQQYLGDPERHPIISIKGIGGIGKTALADFALRQSLQNDQHWHDLIWISAKQEYLTSSGIQGVHSQIRLEMLFDELGQKLALNDLPRLPFAQKLEKLASALRAQPYLVVFDNLESVEDFRQLVPLLMQLAVPTQFVLTARTTVPALSTVTVVDLGELDRAAAHALILYMAEKKAVSPCNPAHVYRLVGGNPLAIILVVSQMAFLPTARVLSGVQTGATADLYTYIYRQAWSILDKTAQELLFAIQRVGDEADYAWLRMATQLPPATLDEALRQLHDLSLVQRQHRDNGQPRYAIHRLTSTFLRTEVLGWK